MPYVFYDELPEGMEEVDVVPRSDYDTILAERDNTIQQRDDALARIEEANKEVRDVKAKYADYVLSASSKPQKKQDPKTEPVRSSLPVSASDLF